MKPAPLPSIQLPRTRSASMPEDSTRRPPRIESIQRLLESREEMERVEGVNRLMELEAQGWMVALLVRLMEDSSWLVRCAAAHALAQMGDPQAIPVLRRHQRWWQEPSREVRRAAGIALEGLLASGLGRAISEVSKGADHVGRRDRSLSTAEGQDSGASSSPSDLAETPTPPAARTDPEPDQ